MQFLAFYFCLPFRPVGLISESYTLGRWEASAFDLLPSVIQRSHPDLFLVFQLIAFGLFDLNRGYHHHVFYKVGALDNRKVWFRTR